MEVPTAGGLWRSRGFLLLWGGQTVSEFGAMVTFVALPLIAIIELRASAFEVSLVTAATQAAWLVVALPAGAWVDRVPRKPLMIISDLVRAVALITVPIAAALGMLTIWHLVSIALVNGVFEVLFFTAYGVFVPAVVDRSRLVDANGKLNASSSAAMIGGPGLGGALVQVLGAPLAVLTDAVSFLVSAVSLARIKVVETVAARGADSRLRGEVIHGLRYVASNPFPRTLAATGAAANFLLGGFEAVLFVFLVREVGLSGALAAVLFGIGAAGGLVGSLITGRLADRFGDARLLSVSMLASGMSGCLMALTTGGAGLAWYVAGSLLFHGSIAVFNVCVRSAVQIGTPPDLLGRTSASIRLFTRGVLPPGALVGGVLATATSARIAMAVLTALVMLVPLILLASPLRTVRNVADLAPTP